MKTELTYKRVERNYEKNGGLGGTKSMTYVCNPKMKQPHTIILRLPAGESVNDIPEGQRFNTVEEARKMWEVVDKKWKGQGYVVK